MLRPLFAPLLALCLLLAPSLSQGEETPKEEASQPAGSAVSRTSGQDPCPESDFPHRLMQPVADCRKQDKVMAATLRDEAMRDDPLHILLIVALSKLERTDGGPSLFGAPASFWEDWLIRLFGEREGCYLLACVLYEISTIPGLPQTEINRITVEYLRKSAALGHPQAMYGLARHAADFPDRTFRMPEHPGFFILPRDVPEDGARTPESRYWLGAAAAAGSPEANFHFGYAHSVHSYGVYDERKALEAYAQAMRLGVLSALKRINLLLNPTGEKTPFPPSTDCKTLLYYNALATYLDEDGDVQEIERAAQLMMQGGNETFAEACLTRTEYEEILRKAKKEGAGGKAALQEKKKAREALLQKAEARLAELRAAFAAQATEQTSPAGAGS
ncbi:hypothetical protein [uncultured Desulfovibrio sp.]|uniref:hypothetical protein n=1 Tax=uncultured Desulfovibrio sp. TaxID=167968 RepID=UPI0026165FBC|nr:hypothetical protein [uncultured Desulfovibrio sp.]